MLEQKSIIKKRDLLVSMNNVYRNGACLAFQYDDGQWGLIITVGCEYLPQRTIFSFAQTDIKQQTMPTMDDVYTAHLLDDDFNSSKRWHRKLSDVRLGNACKKKEDIAQIKQYNELYFSVIGHLPQWNDSTSIITGIGYQPYWKKTYEEFVCVITEHFLHEFENRKRTTETVSEVNSIFSESKTKD
ncbi:MAG: hypothetical protein LBU76_00925 [Azoarcus sp.]|jgi:hypothetical protein|nr:hypothetical protein [Azoarcus sp.]